MKGKNWIVANKGKVAGIAALAVVAMIASTMACPVETTTEVISVPVAVEE